MLQGIITDPHLFHQMTRLSQQIFSYADDMRLAKNFETDFINFLSSLSRFKIAKAEWNSEGPGWLDEIKDHVNSNLTTKISLTALAKLAGLDKYRFIRSFKKIVGLTPFQYVMLARILLARKMLQQGKPLTAAALDAGFYDQSNFSNYFKLYVGVTPKTYQNSCNIFQE